MQSNSGTTDEVKVCIHRGSNQIGGSCVEIECEGKRIIIDMGTPLDAAEETESLVPDIKGLKEGDPSILGIIISHPHRDHYGLIKFASPKIPVYIGEIAYKILEIFSVFVPNAAVEIPNKHFYEDKKPFVVGSISKGEIKITPFLVDHSAFDSYALLIEIAGKKILYSGDIRFHGRKAVLSELLPNNSLLKNLDLVLLEGSSLHRIDENAQFQTEDEIEDRFVEEFNKTQGLALVFASSQNIDRISSVYRACKRTNRILLIDLYVACNIRTCFNLEKPLLPQAVLLVPENQRDFIRDNKLFDLLNEYKVKRTYRESIVESTNKYVLLFRNSYIRDFGITPKLLENARFFCSMWSGYWNENDKSYGKVVRFVKKNKLEKIDIHTSGHASVKDLKSFVEKLGSPLVTPIHTFYPEQFPSLFKNVKIHKDGEWFLV